MLRIKCILEASNKQNMLGRIFCDLKMAFNNVNHETLLSKFHFDGIGGKFKISNASCLSDRYQWVLTASTNLSFVGISHWDIVKQGVLQGSILGPLLFLFYINDLPTIFNNSIKSVLFADDTSLVISCDNNIQYRHEANSSFTHLNAWFSSNLLTLDFNKTKHVQFVTKFSCNSKTCQLSQ
jgi:hypothetical protein